jgi:hypothetical protein
LSTLYADIADPREIAPERPNPAPKGRLVFASICTGWEKEFNTVVTAGISTFDPFKINFGSSEIEAVKVTPSDILMPAPVDPD